MKKAGRAPRNNIMRLVGSDQEKEMLFKAADLVGSNFSVWARQLLLAEAQKILNQQAFAPGDLVFGNPLASLSRSGSEDQE